MYILLNAHHSRCVHSLTATSPVLNSLSPHLAFLDFLSLTASWAVPFLDSLVERCTEIRSSSIGWNYARIILSIISCNFVFRIFNYLLFITSNLMLTVTCIAPSPWHLHWVLFFLPWPSPMTGRVDDGSCPTQDLKSRGYDTHV